MLNARNGTGMKWNSLVITGYDVPKFKEGLNVCVGVYRGLSCLVLENPGIMTPRRGLQGNCENPGTRLSDSSFSVHRPKDKVNDEEIISTSG